MSLVYNSANPQPEVPSLVPRSHYGPITSIKFLTNDTILSSNGPSIQIYKDSKLIKTIRIFGKQKIHGIDISKDKGKAIFYGGRSFTVVQIEDLLQNNDLKVKEYGINDWIMSMSFDFSLQNCYLLTSHNIVYTIALSSFKVIDTKSFSENSILYSGSIKVLEDRVMIASGTILGGVFIWDLFTNKLIHNLIGHEGAIFGVVISPTGEYACSCSDDRSIRVWDLDTGSNLVTGWGHGSRIWQLQWFNGNKIMSCAEDCTARIWDFVRNEDKILYCDDIFELHQGKHIWSGDINEELQIAVTGGADGRVRLIDMARNERKGNWKKEFAISLISQEEGDYFKSYLQFNNGLIVLTALGSCYKFKNFEEWEFLFKDEDLNNFHLLNSIKDENIVLITSKTGSTTVLKFDSNFNVVKKTVLPKPEEIKGKITNVLVTRKSSENFIIFYESPNPKDDFVVYELDFSLNKEPLVTALQKPPTKFNSTCVTFNELNNWLFVGSRFTTFMIFDYENPKNSQFWKKFVKGDTITGCSVINFKKDEIVVLMTIRDGDYFYLKFDDQFNLEVLQHNRIQRGFLEGGFINNENELILLNFKSDTFHLWNETRQIEIFKEQCGGIHRTWHLDPISTAKQNYNFVYNKSSNLIIVNTGDQIFPDSCLNGGTHGREIRDISISTVKRLNGCKLFISGAEDTTVKLSELSDTGVIHNFSSQRKHVSGLQKVKFIESSTYLISTAAREEFFIWKIDDSYQELGPLINCYAALTPSTSEPDLRIMDFDTLPIYKHEILYGWLIVNVYSDSTIKIFEFNISTKQFKLVMEDRHSTCCLWDARLIMKLGRVYTMIGGTDGHIAIYDLSVELEKLYCFFKDEYLELIEQPELEIDPEIEAEIGTKFETIPMFPELVIKQQIHQSGIKSNVLIQHPYDDSIIDLVTGGDDNALVHTRLHFEDRTIHLNIESFKDNAASSTITSLSYLAPQVDSSKRQILVISVDQIVRLWEIDYKGEAKLVCKDSRYTTIGDTGSSDVCSFAEKRIALVGGAGISCWEINE